MSDQRFVPLAPPLLPHRRILIDDLDLKAELILFKLKVFVPVPVPPEPYEAPAWVVDAVPIAVSQPLSEGGEESHPPARFGVPLRDRHVPEALNGIFEAGEMAEEVLVNVVADAKLSAVFQQVEELPAQEASVARLQWTTEIALVPCLQEDGRDAVI